MLSTVRSFDLVLLEEGEEYVSDAACNALSTFPSQVSQSGWTKFVESTSDAQNPSLHRKGRIRIGTKSLIFEPDLIDMPILKLQFQHINKICESFQDSCGVFVSCKQVTSIPTAIYNGKSRFISPYSVYVAKNDGSASPKADGEANILKCLPSFCFIFIFSTVDIQKQLLKKFKKLLELSQTNGEYHDTIPKTGFSYTLIPSREKLLLGGPAALHGSEPIYCWRLKRMVRHGGFTALTDSALYFQPSPNFSRKLCKRMALDRILHIFKRDTGLTMTGECSTALEVVSLPEDLSDSCEKVFRKQYRCIYLEFKRESDRESLVAILRTLVPRAFHAIESKQFRQEMTQLWRLGVLPNFQYLDFLNCVAGRSRYDISHYPVFPWVISDYKSSYLNLMDPKTFRDLSKPMGALNDERLALLKQRMKGIKVSEDIPVAKKTADKHRCDLEGYICDDCLQELWDEGFYLYGSHYSTPALIVFFLIRLLPECQLRLYGGRFDAAARTFRNVRETFENTYGGHSSFFELIPEFYESCEGFLRNSLNITTQDGRLGDVELPQWAHNSPSLFLKLMRSALESEHVSRNLPGWIDLIFGYKQAGPKSVSSDNAFHPLTYLPSIHAGKLKPSAAVASLLRTMEPQAVSVQVREFGQSPIILFDTPHPRRLVYPKWVPESDAYASAPWFIYLEKHSELFGKSASGQSEGFRFNRTIVPSSGTGHLKQVAELSTSNGINVVKMDDLNHRINFVGFADADVSYYLANDGNLILQHHGENTSVLRKTVPIERNSLTCAVTSGDLLCICSKSGNVTLCRWREIVKDAFPISYEQEPFLHPVGRDVGKHFFRLEVHNDSITCADYDNGVLTTGGMDETINRYEITNCDARMVGVFDEQNGPLAALSCKSGLLLSASMGGSLTLWDIRTPQTPIWIHEACSTSRQHSQILSCCISNHYLQIVSRSESPVMFWDIRMLNSLNSTAGFTKQLETPSMSVLGCHCDPGDCVALVGTVNNEPTLSIYDLHTRKNASNISLSNIKHPTLFQVNPFSSHSNSLEAIVANTLGESLLLSSTKSIV
ncbi:conserved hypothetical protein [Theileria equi strain WA]|uniref:BEACH domain-containing protein n=1 Tax=Theileria equi strain WA TaxID=1537102 RepID=L1LC38_THEEQ|nr:conserved hypothetical protein [Theileria equi strain WA]EKX72839.1 conserved hypothetical protein [Theileria equi strain WA]|eukprot:XP_004832291.1 conserved hypothetical protein [Theileria equi strain WA]